MTPRKEGPAKVVVQDESEWGTQYTIEFLGLEVSMHEDSDKADAESFRDEVNEALAPLLARAEMAEKLAEACEALIQDWNASKEPVVKDALAAWDSIKKEGV